MTPDNDTLKLLERALDQAADLIAAVGPGQDGLPTPCADWDVRALVSHLSGQDLATATGQQAGLDPALAEHALSWAWQMLRPEARGRAFGQQVPVPAEAPAYQRLAGWFGRDPGGRHRNGQAASARSSAALSRMPSAST